MAGDGDECPAIGIDLGTTYSCVAVWRHDRVEIIPNEQGNRITPSFVAFTDKERLIGDSAKNQISFNPSNTIFDAKRLIGRRFSDTQVQDDMKLWPFKIVKGTKDKPNIVVTYRGQEKKFAAEEISSMVLSKMKEIAEEYLGRKVKNAVITVPAYFNDSQRQATKDAGTVAGLEVMRVINEPTAAAIAYGLEKVSSITKKTNVLVFDLGGGTFDVSVLTIDGAGKFEVKAVAGDTHLGGQDFDQRVVNHMVKQFLRKHKKDISKDPKALARLMTSCEQAKRVLSSTTETQIAIDCLHEGIDFSMKLTRRKFEELNIELFDRSLETVGECLNEAKMDKKAVDEVVLVGGSTRIPKVQQMLNEYFDGKEPCHGINADEGVAHGAAIMAATLSGKGSQVVQDSLLVDVTPLSLGIEIQGDMVSVIIPRNTPIPTKEMALFRTIKDNQSEVDIKVYQGERTKPCDNYLLDEFTLYGLPPGRSGAICLLVCFEIDVNGILTVSATEISTGAEENITIANARGRMSAEEIEQMVEQADMFKLEDQQHREKVEAYQKLENYAHLSRSKIKSDHTTAMKKLHPRAQKMEDAIEDVLKWLDMNRESGADEFARKLEELKYICDDVNTHGLD